MSEEKKSGVKDFFGKAKKIIDRGLVASKKALGVAGDAVQDFSDKSVVRIEKAQLESKLKKQYEILGEYASGLLASKKSVTSSDKKAQEILKEIERLNAEIKLRADALKDEKTSGTEEKPASKPVAKTSSVKKTSAASEKKPASKAKAAPAKKVSASKTSAKTGVKTTAKTASKNTSKKSEKK